jgi:3-ketosteroid 9alpha-monooxygenase subunit B
MNIVWPLFPLLCLAMAAVGYGICRLADGAIPQRAVPTRIDKRVQETADAVSLYLTAPAGHAENFRHVPGQFVTVVRRVRGRAVQRSYSLANATGEPLRITVKHETGGRLSPLLCEEARVGDDLRVAPPQGRLGDPAIQNPERPIWLWAAGSGIVPLRAIAVEALRSQLGRRVTLVHNNRHVEDVIYAEELAALEAENPYFTVHQRLTSVSPRMAAADVVSLVSSDDTTAPRTGPAAEHFVCGPEGFMTVVEEGLHAAGVPATSIHLEHFAAPTGNDHQRTGREVRLSVRLDEEELEVAGDRGITIVEALEEAGYDPPTSCRSGSCSTCIARTVVGGAAMENNEFLTAEEVEAGLLLTCQALPTADVVEVDFDAVR